MKIWYLINDSTMDYIVGYGNTPDEVLQKCIESRPNISLEKDITKWSVEEFTPDMYNGCLLFY